MMPHLYNKNNTGFSLVETLVATAILLIVIVGPMSIATNAANSTTFANQQIIAYFLAQEGLELAQKGRDDLLLARFAVGGTQGSNVAWDDFTALSGPFDHCYNTACGLEIGDGANGLVGVTNCSNIDNCRLYLTDATDERSQFTHDDGGGSHEATDFTRTITMEEISPNRDILVTSVVRWRTGNQIAVQSTTATTYLYNVYGR